MFRYVQMLLRVARAIDSAPSEKIQKRAEREGFVAISKTLAGVARRIRRDACRVAGARQETCSSEMLDDVWRGGY